MKKILIFTLLTLFITTSTSFAAWKDCTISKVGIDGNWYTLFVTWDNCPTVGNQYLSVNRVSNANANAILAAALTAISSGATLTIFIPTDTSCTAQVVEKVFLNQP